MTKKGKSGGGLLTKLLGGSSEGAVAGVASNLKSSLKSKDKSNLFKNIWDYGFPLIFLLTYLLIHIFMDEEALEEDTSSDAREGDRDIEIWQKYSLRERLLMITLSVVFLVWGGIAYQDDKIKLYWWRIVFFTMIVTALWSIFADTGRGSAYRYFSDIESSEKLKSTCIDFGCGYAPSNTDIAVVRGRRRS